MKLAILLCAAFAPGATASSDVQVNAGHYEHLEVSGDVNSVQVDAPEVVAVDFDGPRIVKIRGLKPGGAVIRMLDKQRRLLWEGSVQVSPNLR
jgi:hypothetical protein